MSLECSECERDLRSGHDPSCSRYVRCKCGHGIEDHGDDGVSYCLEVDCMCRKWEPSREHNE
jgi:hypothetical protein